MGYCINTNCELHLSDKIKHHNYMKKLILAIFAVGIAASTQAQGLLIYGLGGYQSVKNTQDDGLPGTPDVVTKNRGWQFMPGIGYQVNKMFAVGINFGIQGTKTINETGAGITPETRANNLQAGLFARMIMPIGEHFFLYNQLNASYLGGKTVSDDGVAGTPDIENKYKGFGVLWYPSVGVNITRCMAVTFEYGGIGYAQRKWDNAGPSETKQSGFGITFGRGFSFGVQATLGGKKHKGHREPGVDRRMDTSDDDDMPRRSSDDE